MDSAPYFQKTRQNNIHAEFDNHEIAVFSFKVGNTPYTLKYDHGTDMDVASFVLQSI